MKAQKRHGTISATDRTDGSVVLKINVPHSDVAASTGKTFSYAGPSHPFRLAENIYASMNDMLERLRSAGFVVTPLA